MRVRSGRIVGKHVETLTVGESMIDNDGKLTTLTTNLILAMDDPDDDQGGVSSYPVRKVQRRSRHLRPLDTTRGYASSGFGPYYRQKE